MRCISFLRLFMILSKKWSKTIDFFLNLWYNISVVTHRQAKNSEVASEKRRFFEGACPIHETGRQSRYNIFLLCGTKPVSYAAGKMRMHRGDTDAVFCIRSEEECGENWLLIGSPKISWLKDDFGFYFRGVKKHPGMCTIFSMALSCKITTLTKQGGK